MKVTLFPWEKLDAIEIIKKAFNLNGSVVKSVAKTPTKIKAKAKPATNVKSTPKTAKQLSLMA